MNAILLSYLPGMSGDLLAWEIHKDNKFYSFPNIEVTAKNRFLFPNTLECIGEITKTFPVEGRWPINANNVSVIENLYGDKNVCFPTHWHNKLTHCDLPDFFKKGVRLYCKDKKILKISWLLWWIKSHIEANDPWHYRIYELENMIQLRDHRYYELIKLKDSYHNWKFLALKYNLLKNGQPDLYTYIKQHFERVYTKTNVLSDFPGYLNISVDGIIYSDSEVDVLNKFLDIDIDADSIAEYSSKNTKLIESELGINFNSSDFIDDDKFYNFVADQLNTKLIERPIYDYDNRKRPDQSV